MKKLAALISNKQVQESVIVAIVMALIVTFAVVFI